MAADAAPDTLPTAAIAVPRAAPLWRRCIAAVYDGLLLVGLWMSALLIEEVLRAVAGLAHSLPLLRGYLFVVGLGFFAWSWTHGGQTLGMRTWRLRVETIAGPGLRWPAALSRYALTLTVWGLALAPLIARLPKVRDEALAEPVAIASAVLTVGALLARHFDALKRCPQDWLSGSYVVELPPQPRKR